MRNLTRLMLSVAAGVMLAAAASAEPLHLNDKGYFETRGINVLVFANGANSLFNDAKIAGVELIQQGVRTATNGDVRLMPTPGQWDEMGLVKDRQVDAASGVVTTTVSYPKYDFTYQVRVAPKGEGVSVSVILDKPLPKALAGKAGFNMEFLPAAYFHKSYLADGVAGTFPLYPSGPMKSLGEGVPMSRLLPQTEPLPLAHGKTFVLAPEDPARRVTLTSDSDIALYDGRNQAQNGWYVMRSLLPAGKTGTVVSWTMTANSVAGWVRPPMIAHSQLGYALTQAKKAVIELDPNDKPAGEARLLEIAADGTFTPVLTGEAKPWGHYLRYDYRTFDFTRVTKPGLYVIEYDGQRTSPFRIAADIYATAWEPTLDVYLPVAMDHMKVNEAYRVWHGDSHKDDAMQAPPGDDHIDLYASKPGGTDTQFKPYEHIPGLNVGGWFDAGDFDIRTQTHYAVVRSLVQSWEKFGLTRDDTLIDHQRRYVDIHVPDGKPDLLQQIQHGTLQLVAQFDAVGHAINGIVEPDVAEYPHLGDAVTKTDGLIYDRSLGRDEVKDGRSGMPDDRWAFTNTTSALNYGSIAALAAASRALKGFDDPLADKSLGIARKVWAEEHSHAPNLYHHGNTTGGDLVEEELSAAVELLITTKDPQYARRIDALWPEVSKTFAANAATLAKALPLMPKAFKGKVRPAVVAWKAEADKLASANPFGVPITEGGWAGGGTVVEYGLTAAALNHEFPDIVNPDAVYQALDYMYGTHPGSNVSFVSGVGTVSKEVAYGNNRADFSFIAGGVVPGVLILKPDFPENKEDWPFFWGENEYVINVGAAYIELVNEANARLKP